MSSSLVRVLPPLTAMTVLAAGLFHWRKRQNSETDLVRLLLEKVDPFVPEIVFELSDHLGHSMRENPILLTSPLPVSTAQLGNRDKDDVSGIPVKKQQRSLVQEWDAFITRDEHRLKAAIAREMSLIAELKQSQSNAKSKMTEQMEPLNQRFVFQKEFVLQFSKNHSS